MMDGREACINGVVSLPDGPGNRKSTGVGGVTGGPSNGDGDSRESRFPSRVIKKNITGSLFGVIT